MTRSELLKLHEAVCSQARELMARKGADYGTVDPFSNFRMSASLGVHPAKGILIRMGDKLSRVATFVDRGDFKVQDERLKDTVEDLINYSVLLLGVLKEEAWDRPVLEAPRVEVLEKRTDKTLVEDKIPGY